MKTGLQTHAAGRHRQKIHWQRRSLPSGLSRIKVVCCLLVQTLFLVAVFCFYVKKKERKKRQNSSKLECNTIHLATATIEETGFHSGGKIHTWSRADGTEQPNSFASRENEAFWLGRQEERNNEVDTSFWMWRSS